MGTDDKETVRCVCKTLIDNLSEGEGLAVGRQRPNCNMAVAQETSVSEFALHVVYHDHRQSTLCLVVETEMVFVAKGQP